MIASRVRKIILLVLALPTLSLADTAASTVAGSSGEIIAVDSLLRMSGGLLLVLIVMALVFWLMKRAQVFKGGLHSELKVLGAISVGQREKLVLAQVGDAQILVGVAPGSINKIHVLDKPIATESQAIKNQTTEKSAGTGEQSFASRLARALSKNNSTGGAAQ